MGLAMVTIRELCTVIGLTLHVPDIQRWAASLVRAGLLPRASAEADASDAAVIQAPTLEETQQLVEERARFTRNMPLLAKARRHKTWKDMGQLKRLVVDELIRERNAFAQEVMKDVREREAELRAVP